MLDPILHWLEVIQCGPNETHHILQNPHVSMIISEVGCCSCDSVSYSSVGGCSIDSACSSSGSSFSDGGSVGGGYGNTGCSSGNGDCVSGRCVISSRGVGCVLYLGLFLFAYLPGGCDRTCGRSVVSTFVGVYCDPVREFGLCVVWLCVFTWFCVCFCCVYMHTCDLVIFCSEVCTCNWCYVVWG